MASKSVKIQEEEMDELPCGMKLIFKLIYSLLSVYCVHIFLLTTLTETHFWKHLFTSTIVVAFPSHLYQMTFHSQKSFNQNKKHRSEIKMSLRVIKTGYQQKNELSMITPQ